MMAVTCSSKIQEKLNQLRMAKEKLEKVKDRYQKLLDHQSQIIQTKSKIELLHQLVQDNHMK